MSKPGDMRGRACSEDPQLLKSLERGVQAIVAGAEAEEVGRSQITKGLLVPAEKCGLNSESYEEPLKISKITRLEL